MTPLEEFLQQISLLSDQDAITRRRGQVTLMTLHNAKGLEFDVVFMIGCEEGVFPHSRSVEEGNLEEERRLCYVGDHPRPQRLYVTCAQRRSASSAAGRIATCPPASSARSPTSWSSAGSPRTGCRRLAAGAGHARRPDRAARAEACPSVEFRTGDDVVHASFGEGVVTAVEPAA